MSKLLTWGWGFGMCDMDVGQRCTCDGGGQRQEQLGTVAGSGKSATGPVSYTHLTLPTICSV
eukprot:10980308-Alexandrium_andersonii.AAC.1